MLEAVELPAGIAHLASCLADVHADTLTLREKVFKGKEEEMKKNLNKETFKNM